MKIQLPSWQSLPTIALYNDQVIEYVEQIFQPFQLDDVFNITRAMINNYLKVGLVPTYDKKKFKREQLALIIMVTFFKPTFTLQEMKYIIEALPSHNVEHIYTQFVLACQNNKDDSHPLMFYAVQAVSNKIAILQTIENYKENTDE